MVFFKWPKVVPISWELYIYIFKNLNKLKVALLKSSNEILKATLDKKRSKGRENWQQTSCQRVQASRSYTNILILLNILVKEK